MQSLSPRTQPEESAAPESDAAERKARFGSTSAVVPVLGHHTAPGVIVEQKYELVRLLGEGGMGAVWVAKHLTLDVHVALKVMHGELGQIPGAADRMLQEARAAACIGHPAIVQVFDYGRTGDGDPFISMELLHGESLAQALNRRGRLQAVRALQVLLPIADALAVCHQRGIVHRDLKPDNVFLARLADGRVQPKILDFGIAKLDTSTSPKLTQQGTVLGSPAYMAPEQAWGESDIDQRADVWAFSVMLYELLTGTTPFLGDSYNALLFAIARNEPASILEHGVLEPELWEILKRGMEKNRDARYQDMRELGRAFAAWLVARGVKTDITKAPLTPWVEQRVSPHSGASLFPSLSPNGDSSEPPPVIEVTRIGNPALDADALEVRKAATPVKQATEAGHAAPVPPAKPREVRIETKQSDAEPKVVERLRRNAAGLRFSFKTKRAVKSVAVSQRSEASRVGQFVAVAVLSAAAFVGAAYFQSQKARHAAPAEVEPAPSAVVSAKEPVNEPAPNNDGVPSISLADLREKGPSALADPQPRELHREKSAVPNPRARPRKRPSSGDLKNPFR